MNRLVRFIFAFSLLPFASLYADPLVQFPTGNAAWRVDITDLHASGPETRAGKLKQAQAIEVTQVDNVKRLRITWNIGGTTEWWAIANLPVVFNQYPSGDVFPVEIASREFLFNNLDAPSDLSAFSWVTPACRKEKDPISYKGKQCFHYVGSIAVSFPAGGPAQFKREAWIDSKTLLPVSLDTETSHCVFTFLPPPAGPLEMPGKFKKVLAYYKRAMGLQ